MESMNLSKALNIMVDTARAVSFNDSEQLSLGQLIEKLEGVTDKTQLVMFDFGWFYPTTLNSWRGIYKELALGYDNEDAMYDKHPKAEELIKLLRDGIGKTFEGWKSGHFTMSENTPIWVDNYGEGANTAVINVTDLGHLVIINTAYIE